MYMTEIKKVGCIGSGTIGSSWAALFSANGYDVKLYDLEEDILDNAINNMESQLRFLSDKGFIEGSIDDIISGIDTTTDLSEALDGVDYVQESAPEDYGIKKDMFRKMDEKVSEDVILASSTSGLMMTRIQEVTKNPERCVIAHPWNPPLLVPLVEIVPGEETSSETVDTTVEVMEDLGKYPAKLKKEVPGFIGNRIQAAVWREACSLVKQGVASVEEVDKAISMGPGLRWSFMGPNLTFHLGGGEGGLEHFIEHLADGFSEMWKDMGSWEQFPYTTAKEVIGGMEDYDIAEEKGYEEIVNWRDEKLVSLLSELHDKENL